jgi:pyruvate/oxaloacetate carboxyltransferase
VSSFTNFDANNDPANHVAVAEAVHKAGKHFQAALSWAVVHSDPTIYNVKWAVQWFKRIVRDLCPHSLYLKDPSGVMTPEMAGVLAAELKAEFPTLPLVFHTHCQTGFGYMTYLEAMRHGANAVECSLGFPDGNGQPYGLTMLRAAEDYGLDTGNPDKEAWHKVNMLCKERIRPLYRQGQVVRTPDIAVELTGIAGGQRSILDKELRDAGQERFIPLVDSMVQQVRREGGLVCQVTPAADSYAREAMRRIRAGIKGPDEAARGHFVTGYAQILVGENGGTKEPVVDQQRRVALDERVQKHLNDMLAEKRISQAAADALRGMEEPSSVTTAHAAASSSASSASSKGKAKGKDVPFAGTVLGAWRARMEELSAPVMLAQRAAEVEARLGELADLAKDPALLESLERKIAHAAEQAPEGAPERKVKRLADRVALLRSELAQLQSSMKKNKQTPKEAEEAYHAVLLGKAPDALYEEEFIDGHPLARSAYASGALTLEHVKELLSFSGQITCSPIELLRPGLARAKRELAAFEEEHLLGLMDSPRKAAENAVLWACFARSAVPNMLQNFFLHYYTGDHAGFFPKLFEGDKEGEFKDKIGTLQAEKDKAAKEHTFLYRNAHQQVERLLTSHSDSAALMRHLQEQHAQCLELQLRLDRWNDPSLPTNTLIAPETRARLAAKLQQLREEAARGQAQLEQLVLSHIKLHPGRMRDTVPVFDDKAASHVRFAPLGEAAAQQATQDAAAVAETCASTAAASTVHAKQAASACNVCMTAPSTTAPPSAPHVAHAHGRGSSHHRDHAHTTTPAAAASKGSTKAPAAPDAISAAEAEEFAVAKHALDQIVHHP